jgi:hypothetical protein
MDLEVGKLLFEGRLLAFKRQQSRRHYRNLLAADRASNSPTTSHSPRAPVAWRFAGASLRVGGALLVQERVAEPRLG